jgi:hypothetical protein
MTDDVIRFAEASQAQWKALVELVWKHGITEICEHPQWINNSKANLRKCWAIHHSFLLGMTGGQIVSLGQTAALSRVAKHQSNGREPRKRLCWLVSASLADAVQSDDPSPDAEEALVSRLYRVCELRTSEDLWDFLVSVFSDMDDNALRHLAGVIVEKKQKSTRRPQVPSR